MCGKHVQVDHPRLIPKAGAGPALRRDGGREIDEYLMRLLRIGAASDLEARVYAEVRHVCDTI